MKDPDDVPKARSNPRPTPPNVDPGLGPNPQPERSLVEDMQPIVDDARQLNTDFGLRPYRVVSVVVRWTGGERGRGDPVVESEKEFLPTPKVKDYSASLDGELKAAGITDRGTIRLSEISARYTEDDLDALFHLQPLPKDREGFVEVRHDRRDGETKRRRFVVEGVPFHDAENFQWVCRLLAQDPDRTRAGVPRDVRTHAFR